MMNPFMDPSKMDPKVLMELSQIVRQLPPDQLQRMQTMMHNMMAGFDVRAEMEEFEKSLPPGFREKLMAILGPAAFPQGQAASPAAPVEVAAEMSEMNEREARLTILRAVAQGHMSPEEAEKLLFS